jgi:hypothetical protein
MTDYSRLTPQQIAMQSAKEKYQREKDSLANDQQNLRDRITNQNNTSHRSLHDLLKSDFHKTVTNTLSNNRKKEHIQKHMNDTLDNLPNDKLDDFANKF